MWRTSNPSRYYLSEIWMNLRAAYGSSIGAIFTIAIAVAIFGGFWTMERTLAHLARDWEDRVPLVIFLHDEFLENARERLQERLRKLPGVMQLNYISKEAALDEFRPNLTPASERLAELEDNPLPASLVVRYNRRIAGALDLAALKTEISAWTGVDEVAYSSATGRQLTLLRQRLTFLASVVGGLLVLGLLVVVVNTVRLTIEARGDEIAIMSLVGASRSLIRLPLLCEGLFQALVGALLATGILYGLSVMWPEKTISLVPRGFDEAPIIFLPPWQLLQLVGATALLGLIGSFVAVRRYLSP